MPATIATVNTGCPIASFVVAEAMADTRGAPSRKSE